MKILLCDENKGFGGSERYLLDLAEGLRRRRHEVQLFIRRGSWLERQLPLQATTTSFSGELDPRALWKLGRLQSAQHFDVVHCHATRDMVVAATLKRLGARFALVKSEHCFLGHQRSALLNWAYTRCDRVLPVSQCLRQQMSRELPGCRFEVISNGIVLPQLPRSIPPRLLQGRWVGYLSSFLPGKGQSQALRAIIPLLRKDPDLNLLLGGDGPTRADIQAQVQSSGVHERIWLPGHIDNPLDYLAGLEVVLLPSSMETFSLVCLEAMAVGRPVVAYGVGGIPEVVSDGVNGTLVAEGQVEMLQSAVERYLADAQLAASHGQQGRQRAMEWFDFERVLERTENLYRQIA